MKSCRYFAVALVALPLIGPFFLQAEEKGPPTPELVAQLMEARSKGSPPPSFLREEIARRTGYEVRKEEFNKLGKYASVEFNRLDAQRLREQLKNQLSVHPLENGRALKDLGQVLAQKELKGLSIQDFTHEMKLRSDIQDLKKDFAIFFKDHAVSSKDFRPSKELFQDLRSNIQGIQASSVKENINHLEVERPHRIMRENFRERLRDKLTPPTGPKPLPPGNGIPPSEPMPVPAPPPTDFTPPPEFSPAPPPSDDSSGGTSGDDPVLRKRLLDRLHNQ